MKTILLTLLFAISSLTIASGGGKHGKRKMHKKMRKHKKQKLGKMKERLGLSEDQTAKIKSIRESHRTQMKSLREQKRAAKKQFKEAMKSSNQNPEQLRSLFNVVQNKKSQLANARFEKRLAVRSILTPDQLAKRKNFDFDEKDESEEQE